MLLYLYSAPLSSNPSSMVPEYKVSGKKGGFSPTEVKSTAGETSKKRKAPSLPANEVKRKTSVDVTDSAEVKSVEKNDKEQPPVKHIAKRKAPPPPKGVKKDIAAAPSSQPESEANLSLKDAAHSSTHVKQPPPGSPAKRPAPVIPTATQQPAVGGRQMLKITSDSVLVKQQPPPSPTKGPLPNMAEDVTDHHPATTSAPKKRRPAPTRPPPHAVTLPDPHKQHNIESGR